MTFFTTNVSQQNSTIAETIVHREREIFAYDLNISNYESILATLPQGDWPVELAQYRTATLDQVPDEHDATVTEYQFKDRLHYLLKTERAERLKTFKIYEALVNQLPEADRVSLITAAVARIDSQG
jgi:hypothetical protein